MQDHRIEGVGEVDAEDLLALLDAENVHDVGHDEVGFSCLYVAGHAHGDRNPSAHINRETLLWRCKGCGRAGNLLELTKIGLPNNASHVEALRWLREHFGEDVRKPHGGSLTNDLLTRLEKARYVPSPRRLPNEAATIGPEGIFAIDWRSDHEAARYMRRRGFAPEVLEGWTFGFDHWTYRVAIPVRDETGTLVGFKGRAIDDSSSVKYLLLGDVEGREPRYGVGYGFDMHDARSVVFGLDRVIVAHGARGSEDLSAPTGEVSVRVRPAPIKRVALCEGELNVIACHSAGVPAVAPGTTSITDEQLWLLRAHVDELVEFYDSDEAGEGAMWGRVDPDNGRFYPGLCEKISPYFRLYSVPEHEDDPAGLQRSDPARIRELYEAAEHWLRVAF